MAAKGYRFAGIQIGQYVFEALVKLPPKDMLPSNAGILLSL